MPKMPMSLAFACDRSAENVSEPAIVPKEEWFPKPPEPEEPEIPDNGIPPEPATEYPLGPSLYDFSSPVPLSDPVDDRYFLNTLLIGDSRMVGVGAWGGVKTYCYARVALTIRGVMSIPFIEDTLGEEPVTRTIIDTIREYPVFENVYIAFGLNEMGWSKNAFVNTYEEVVTQIMELLPDADIYLQAIIPVTKSVSDKGTNGITNDKIREFNRELQKLAEKLEIFYLAVDEGYYDEEGNLPDGSAAKDGIHFGGAISREIIDYYRTHVVDHDAYEWEIK
nr:hypothetical protein [Clostridia bacterium]